MIKEARTRWIRPHELDRSRSADRFDPLAFGERYGLPAEQLRELWELACAEAAAALTGPVAGHDEALARQRFHGLAARRAAGALRGTGEVGRTTRVLADARDAPDMRDARAGRRRPHAPGRETLVEVEAARAERAARAYGELDATSVRPADGIVDPIAQVAHAARGASGELPYRARMERLFGASFASVRAHTGRAAELAPLGSAAAATGETVVFAASAPGPALVAHELAHVLQYRRSGAGSQPVSRPDDDDEREAEHAVQRMAARRGAPAWHPPQFSARLQAQVQLAWIPHPELDSQWLDEEVRRSSTRRRSGCSARPSRRCSMRW